MIVTFNDCVNNLPVGLPATACQGLKSLENDLVLLAKSDASGLVICDKELLMYMPGDRSVVKSVCVRFNSSGSYDVINPLNLISFV